MVGKAWAVLGQSLVTTSGSLFSATHRHELKIFLKSQKHGIEKIVPPVWSRSAEIFLLSTTSSDGHTIGSARSRGVVQILSRQSVISRWSVSTEHEEDGFTCPRGRALGYCRTCLVMAIWKMSPFLVPTVMGIPWAVLGHRLVTPSGSLCSATTVSISPECCCPLLFLPSMSTSPGYLQVAEQSQSRFGWGKNYTYAGQVSVHPLQYLWALQIPHHPPRRA